jgi:radical SAM superfamily enzyme YgiQ (UPF0313 family)
MICPLTGRALTFGAASTFGGAVTRFRPLTRRAASTFGAAVGALHAEALLGRYRVAVADHPPAARKDVLLLQPPGACSQFTRSGSRYPPLGLNQLKAVIGDATSVEVLEADGLELTVDQTVDQLRVEMPRAVGMTITCGTKALANAWGAVAKNLVTDGHAENAPIVIVGGPSTAFESAEILRDCAEIDVIVRGEGEVTFPKIVAVLRRAAEEPRATVLAKLSAIAGVIVRDAPPRTNDMSIPTLPKEAFQTLPFPDLSSSPVHKYWAPDARGLTPMVTIMTQRGCPGKCGFCNTPQIHGQNMRGWSNEQVVRELARLKAAHGIRLVSFVDDVFTNRPGGGVRGLCKMMVDARLDLAWYCNARADGVSPRIAEAMKAAGCFQVFVGFESGCDEMLLRIGKGETAAQLEQGAAVLKSAGIGVSVGFIIGLPGETQASVDKTIALCNRVQPERVQFTRYTPIKGSPLAAGHAHDSSGFHDRARSDQVEEWLQQCYAACNYKPSV